jgi:hypothetical protein
MPTKKAGSQPVEVDKAKRTYFRHADFPQNDLQQAQRVASAIVDNFAGNEGTPPDIVLAIRVNPTSSAWRALTGSAIAYGLTDGGVNANVIKLLPLGRKLVAPEVEGDDLGARRETIMKPRIMKEFFGMYRRAKFPSDTIALNVLKAMGIPPERAQPAIETVKANGRYAGIIRDTPAGPFVSLDAPGVPVPVETPALPEHGEEEATEAATTSSVETPPALVGAAGGPRERLSPCRTQSTAAYLSHTVNREP